MVAKCETMKIANANSLTGSNQSSSHSPSVTGDSIEVKVSVEITPPQPPVMSEVSTSFSIESTSSLTICSDNSNKSLAASPNARKFSESQQDSTGSFLNAIGNFNRMNANAQSSASASTRLFKRLEEMIDLSTPYNHYRCLSPSETNLAIPPHERPASVSPNCSMRLIDSNRPGSSRLLRRQFSLDKDDLSLQKHGNLETISSMIDGSRNLSTKAAYQSLISSSSLPSGSASLAASKIHKHQSASVAQDLEKIEEIPISPLNASLLSSNGSLHESFKVAHSSKSGERNGNTRTRRLPNFDATESNLNVEKKWRSRSFKVWLQPFNPFNDWWRGFQLVTILMWWNDCRVLQPIAKSKMENTLQLKWKFVQPHNRIINLCTKSNEPQDGAKFSSW